MFGQKEVPVPVDDHDASSSAKLLTNMVDKAKQNWFILGVIFVILLAHANPDIGVKGGKLFIFLISVH